jgi:hypothetical protein
MALTVAASQVQWIDDTKVRSLNDLACESSPLPRDDWRCGYLN